MNAVKSLHCILFVAVAQLSVVAIADEDLPLPLLTKGIWAIRHEQEMEGQQARTIPDRLTTRCIDPQSKIREDIMSMQKQGCSVKHEPGSAESETIYSANCEAGAGGSKKIQISIISMSPNRFKVINESKEGRNVMEGHLVRDCP